MTREQTDMRFIGENEGEKTVEGNFNSSTDSFFTCDICKKVCKATAESADLKQT